MVFYPLPHTHTFHKFEKIKYARVHLSSSRYEKTFQQLALCSDFIEMIITWFLI